MNISQLLSSAVRLLVNPPTLEEVGRVMLEANLTTKQYAVNPPILGFYEGFLISDGSLSCIYYSRYMQEDDGKFAQREILIIEVKDRIGELFVAFKDGIPTAWRMGLEKEYRPSITEHQIYAARSMLAGAQKAVAIAKTRGAQSA